MKSLAATPKAGSFPNRHVEVCMLRVFLLVDKKSLKPITFRIPKESVLLLPWSTEIEKLEGNFLTKLQLFGIISDFSKASITNHGKVTMCDCISVTKQLNRAIYNLATFKDKCRFAKQNMS